MPYAAGGAPEAGRPRRPPSPADSGRPASARRIDSPAGSGHGGLDELRRALGGKPPRGAETPRGGDRGDARTLAVKYDKSGTPCRDFKEAVELCEEAEIPGFLVRGPRTAGWVLKFLAEQGTPLQRHTRFKSEAHLSTSDPGVAQHEQICKLLQVGATFDQLDMCNLAMVELLCRELQMIEEKYSEKLRSQNGLSEEAHLFLGTNTARGNVCMDPRLREWISGELRDEAAIAKERRKAREERQLLRTPTTEADAKGGGRGNPKK